jgi:acetylornithine/succinyldiaminopimelate/putrescine aminotransferase
MAGLFKEGLRQLQRKYPALLVQIRQRGLMMGLKLASHELGPLLTLAGFRHGVLTIYANHDQSVNQLLPPLTIEAGEVDQVLERLDRMLAWVGTVGSDPSAAFAQ